MTLYSRANNWRGRKLLGKAPMSYTVEQLQRLLQEWGWRFDKHMTKAHLINRVFKYIVKHPKITDRDRMKILSRPLHSQHIRWQVMNEDRTQFLWQAYPPGTMQMMLKHGETKVQQFNDSLGDDPKRCTTCKMLRPELDFPKPSMCCKKDWVHCRSCLNSHVRSKLGRPQSFKCNVNCMMCNRVMKKRAVEALTTAATYEMYKKTPLAKQEDMF